MLFFFWCVCGWVGGGGAMQITKTLIDIPINTPNLGPVLTPLSVADILPQLTTVCKDRDGGSGMQSVGW